MKDRVARNGRVAMRPLVTPGQTLHYQISELIMAELEEAIIIEGVEVPSIEVATQVANDIVNLIAWKALEVGGPNAEDQS